jgi:hypothetical protein
MVGGALGGGPKRVRESLLGPEKATIGKADDSRFWAHED